MSQRGLSGHQVTAPTDGVIVRWRIRVGAASPAQPVTFRVIRGIGADSTGAGSSDVENVPAAPGIYTFDARIAVAAGDFIGIDCCPGLAGGTFFDSTPAAQLDLWQPPLADGASRGPQFQYNYELMLNADLEPDCDGDGFGDETQDPTPACPRTLVLDASKNRVRKGKRVTLSGQLSQLVRQTECQSAQTVELQRKRPSRTSFTTFEQLQTDAAGVFSTRRKVKKTFEYRAQVPESATCAGQTSNTEKVKVKKRR
jgi:hypothetical protein